MNQFNVLITSAGRRTQLLEHFRNSITHFDASGKIITCDSNPSWSAACKISDLSFESPLIDSTEYIPFLLNLCKKENIKALIPTNDMELIFLSENRELFLKQGTYIPICDRKFVEIARSKLKTSKLFAEVGIQHPPSISLCDEFTELKNNNELFPAVIKPDDGSNSQGLYFVDTFDELRNLKNRLGSLDGSIIQKRIVGREYTINCYFNDVGRLIACVPHLRVKIRGGEVEKAVTCRQIQLEQYSQLLEKNIEEARGPICFQAIEDDKGNFYCIEINARFGGGYPLAHEAGATFTDWIIADALALSVEPLERWINNLKMIRYDNAVFE